MDNTTDKANTSGRQYMQINYISIHLVDSTCRLIIYQYIDLEGLHKITYNFHTRAIIIVVEADVRVELAINNIYIYGPNNMSISYIYVLEHA